MSSVDYWKSPLPLVNDTNIQNFIKQYVIIHGKVQSINNNTLSLLVNPSTNVEILINGFNQKFEEGTYLKIIGKVESDKSIEYVDNIVLQNDFDLELCNQVVPLWNHKEVAGFFYL